ncbi:hypothetical protein Tco_0455470 [Tanacetum coccineum]
MGEQSSFWNDIWLDDVAFKDQYGRLFALEDSKLISVASKLGHPSLFYSFRRQPRGGVEQESFNLLSSKVQSVISFRVQMKMLVWSLVAVANQYYNVFDWKVSLDACNHPDLLPTRLQLSLRGMEKDSNLVGAW